MYSTQTSWSSYYTYCEPNSTVFWSSIVNWLDTHQSTILPTAVWLYGYPELKARFCLAAASLWMISRDFLSIVHLRVKVNELMNNVWKVLWPCCVVLCSSLSTQKIWYGRQIGVGVSNVNTVSCGMGYVLCSMFYVLCWGHVMRQFGKLKTGRADSTTKAIG